MNPPPSQSRPVTLADVAARVGVSARTVSRVVNGQGGCTAETQQRILHAIDELGYRPNLLARGLIRRRSDIFGLVTAELSDPFFPEFAEGVERAARGVGRSVFVMASGFDPEGQRAALTSLRGLNTDGVIIFPAGDIGAELASLARAGVPVVAVNSELEGESMAHVSAEIKAGAGLAVEHLLETGRRRIALAIDRRAHTDPLPSRRESGYRETLRANGLDVDEELVVAVDNSHDGGREAARRLLALDVPPDAIFTYNDVMALGVLQHLLEAGVDVPGDIAVVGFDDVTMCDLVTPRLSSVRIDRDLLGEMAVEVLIELLDSGRARSRTIPVELVVRASSSR